MQMIGKLREDKKADWPSHLAEIVHAYNATHSAVTGVQSTLFNVWTKAKAPGQLLLPHHWQH